MRLRSLAFLALFAAHAPLAGCKRAESEPCPVPSAKAATTAAPAPSASVATVPAATAASDALPPIERCCAAIEHMKVPKKQAGLVVSALGLCRRAEGPGGMFTLDDVRTVLDAAKLTVPKECAK